MEVIITGNDMKPYSQEKISENSFIRTFDSDTDVSKLVWHRDKSDRVVEVIQNDGWKFQFDNEIPFILKEKITIPKETFHRILKGNGDLVIKIIEI